MTTLTLNPATRHELKIFGLLAAVFAAVYFLPVGTPRFDGAVSEALELTKWYAREHVVLCLLPAFWIAGAIAAFVSPGVGHALPRSEGVEAARVRRRLGLGHDPRRLQLHRAATVLGHLPHGRRPRPGNRIPLFRPRDQRARDRDDREGARCAARHRTRARCGGVQRRDRPGHGVHLPSRGKGEGGGGHCVAGTAGWPAFGTDCGILRRPGRHPGLRELGRCVADDGLLRRRPLPPSGWSPRCSAQCSRSCSGAGSSSNQRESPPSPWRRSSPRSRCPDIQPGRFSLRCSVSPGSPPVATTRPVSGSTRHGITRSRSCRCCSAACSWPASCSDAQGTRE